MAITSMLFFLALMLSTLTRAATIHGPLLPDRFPDPTIIHVNDTYYAFSSRDESDHKTINVPIATSKSFTSGWSLLKEDALPHAGKWTAKKPQVLTPDVNQLADGTFILYYIAVPSFDEKKHCIGAATAKKVTGPYKPQSTPLLCPKSHQQGDGTADPNLLRYKNDNYLVFKNASGHDPQKQSYIAIESVKANGFTSTSRWTDLINSTDADQRDVEGPCLVANPAVNNQFALFFTTGTFNTTNLRIEYAVSNQIDGPYDRKGILLESSEYSGLNISAPVGLDVVPTNVSQAVFEAFDATGVRPRRMYAVELDYSDGTVTIL